MDIEYVIYTSVNRSISDFVVRSAHNLLVDSITDSVYTQVYKQFWGSVGEPVWNYIHNTRIEIQKYDQY
jgi:hypothetical protein